VSPSLAGGRSAKKDHGSILREGDRQMAAPSDGQPTDLIAAARIRSWTSDQLTPTLRRQPSRAGIKGVAAERAPIWVEGDRSSEVVEGERTRADGQRAVLETPHRQRTGRQGDPIAGDRNVVGRSGEMPTAPS